MLVGRSFFVVGDRVGKVNRLVFVEETLRCTRGCTRGELYIVV